MGKELELTCWQRFVDWFYDVSAAVVSIVDVLTDILITIEFYNDGRDTFFWIAVSIFGLANFCYTTFFILAYTKKL